tara:strand:+ start:14566 stop:15693 length:1128 start_codon:yes stop_codon:yes gene_type:complete
MTILSKNKPIIIKDIYDFFKFLYDFKLILLSMTVLGFLLPSMFITSTATRVKATHEAFFNNELINFLNQPEINFDQSKYFLDLEFFKSYLHEYVKNELEDIHADDIANEVSKYRINYTNIDSETSSDSNRAKLVIDYIESFTEENQYGTNNNPMFNRDYTENQLVKFTNAFKYKFESDIIEYIDKLREKLTADKEQTIQFNRYQLQQEQQVYKNFLLFQLETLSLQKNIAIAAGIDQPREDAPGFPSMLQVNTYRQEKTGILNGYLAIEQKIQEINRLMENGNFQNNNTLEYETNIIKATYQIKLKKLDFLIKFYDLKLDGTPLNSFYVMPNSTKSFTLDTTVPYTKYLYAIISLLTSTLILLFYNGGRLKKINL